MHASIFARRRPGSGEFTRILALLFCAASASSCSGEDSADVDSGGAGASNEAGQGVERAGATNQGGQALGGREPVAGGTSTGGATPGSGGTGPGSRGGTAGTGTGGTGTGGRGGSGGVSTGGAGTGGIDAGGGTEPGGSSGASAGGQLEQGGTGVAGDEPGGSSGAGVGGQAQGGNGEAAAGGVGKGGSSGAGVGGQAELGGTSGTSGAGWGGNEPGGSDQGGTAGAGGVTPEGGTAGTIEQDCPDSTDYVGDPTWPHQLRVTDAAEYCGAFDEMRDLEQEYAAKAKIRVAPGTYPLSETVGSYDFALPICFEFRPGLAVPHFAGAGTVETSRNENPLRDYLCHTQQFEQPLRSPSAETWILRGHFSYWEMAQPPQPLPQVLDGSPLDVWGDTGHAASLLLCKGEEWDDVRDVRFGACAADYPTSLVHITFEGGQVTFELGITGGVGTQEMLSVFREASGTLDGTPFSQTDYFKLVYSADHHHFIRDFAVLFDEPIGDACGLKVLELIAYDPTTTLPQAFTIDCQLGDIEGRPVSDASVEAR